MRAGWWYRGFYSRQERRRRSSEWTRKLLWLQLEAKKRAFFRQLPPFQGSEAISSGYRFSGAKTRERMGPTSEIRERETGWGSCKAAHASSIARFRGGMRLLLEIGPVRMCSKGMRNGIRTLLELAG
jgi:hypothetical protein